MHYTTFFSPLINKSILQVRICKIYLSRFFWSIFKNRVKRSDVCISWLHIRQFYYRKYDKCWGELHSIIPSSTKQSFYGQTREGKRVEYKKKIIIMRKKKQQQWDNGNRLDYIGEQFCNRKYLVAWHYKHLKYYLNWLKRKIKKNRKNYFPTKLYVAKR